MSRPRKSYRGLRGWIDTVDRLGELKRVSGAHWDVEMGAVTHMLTEKSGGTAPAILFDDVPGYAKGFRTLYGQLSSIKRIALTLGLPLQHARKYFLPFSDTFLPVWSLWATGVVIPFIELIGGALVILGLRTREALIALGFVLAIVTFGHLLKEPLYEFHTHVIPRLALLLFVFMLPREDDRFSLDHLIAKKRA